MQSIYQLADDGRVENDYFTFESSVNEFAERALSP